MMKAKRSKLLLAWIAVLAFLIGCIPSSCAEESAVDAEKNLAEFGLTPDDVVSAYSESTRGTMDFWFPARPDGSPTYIWFDVTGDGCVDLCTGRVYGSGMVRRDIIVYDPVNREKYILDGYNYDFYIDGISENRLVVIKKGPNGYGDPVKEFTGTTILDNGILVFVADPKPVSSDSDSLFDLSQAPVPYRKAVEIASAFVKEFLDAEYYDEIQIQSEVSVDENGSVKCCWIIDFYWLKRQDYIVYVNAETGEIETSYTVSEGIG